MIETNTGFKFFSHCFILQSCLHIYPLFILFGNMYAEGSYTKIRMPRSSSFWALRHRDLGWEFWERGHTIHTHCLF